jgi:hypothetical protein
MLPCTTVTGVPRMSCVSVRVDQVRCCGDVCMYCTYIHTCTQYIHTCVVGTIASRTSDSLGPILNHPATRTIPSGQAFPHKSYGATCHPVALPTISCVCPCWELGVERIVGSCSPERRGSPWLAELDTARHVPDPGCERCVADGYFVGLIACLVLLR